MAITSIDQILDGLAHTGQSIVLNKIAVTSQLASGETSLWRVATIPFVADLPTTPTLLSKDTLGAAQFTNASSGRSLYLGRAFTLSGTAASHYTLRDRIGQMAGLSGTVTTAQTVNLDVSGSSFNLVERRGAADYSDLYWGVEVYTTLGATARTLTVTYTDHNDTPGNTTTCAIPATTAAGRYIPFYPASASNNIKSVQSVQLNASTGTAGNFGITCSRPIFTFYLGTAFAGEVWGWQRLGLPVIPNDSCLFFTTVNSIAATTGTLYGALKLIEG